MVKAQLKSSHRCGEANPHPLICQSSVLTTTLAYLHLHESGVFEDLYCVPTDPIGPFCWPHHEVEHTLKQGTQSCGEPNGSRNICSIERHNKSWRPPKYVKDNLWTIVYNSYSGWQLSENTKAKNGEQKTLNENMLEDYFYVYTQLFTFNLWTILWFGPKKINLQMKLQTSSQTT